MKKKTISLLLAIVMLIAAIPLTSTAVEKEYVYLSISFDGRYINDKNGNPIIYLPIELDKIEKVDLTEYGLDDMLYDADGDGEYETTALQLLIYAHEELYGGDWSDVDFDAIPGSSYFKDGIFGFTENLMYFHNGDFPVDESMSSDWMTVGATSDRIVLESGDFIDVASFECWAFCWDMLGGFHFFADEDENYTHDFSVEAGETLSFKLMHSFCDLMYGQAYLYGAADYEVYYGKTYGKAEGTLATDGDGNVDVTISKPGTYYLWCYGANGSDDGTHSSCDYYFETEMPCIVSAPAYAKLTVVGEADCDSNGHNYVPEITLPTCTKGGYTTYTCSVCSDSYIGDEREKLGHDMGDFLQTSAPTCTENGEEKSECSRCDYCETRDVETDGHNYVPEITLPTCTKGGYTTYTCSVCSDSYIGDEKEKLGHDMGDFLQTSAPTCTENGEEKSECSRCDYCETRDVETDGHNYVPEITLPTCTEMGYTTYTCTCGDSYVTDYVSEAEHYDGNSDNACDSCGTQLDEETVNCSCNCHKGGIAGIIWKILNFIYRIFGMNKICSCGVAHY